MNKIKDLPCKKCGGNTTLDFVPSSGMDIEPTGLFRKCNRCGFEEKITSLDEKESPLLTKEDLIKSL